MISGWDEGIMGGEVSVSGEAHCPCTGEVLAAKNHVLVCVAKQCKGGQFGRGLIS